MMDVAAPYEVGVQPQVATAVYNIATLPAGGSAGQKPFQVSGNGNLNGNLVVTGTASSFGYTQPVTGYGVYVAPSLTGNTFQIGVFSGPVIDSGATAWGAAVYAKVNTVAATYTLGTIMTVNVGSPGLGAGTTVTNQYGVYVYNQGSSQTTNAYGIYVANTTGATSTNIGIRTDGSLWVYYNTISIGWQSPNPTIALNIVHNFASGLGSFQIGQKFVPGFSADCTGGQGLYFQPTANSSAVLGAVQAFYIDGPNFGTAACTNYYGLYVKNQGRAQTTNNYGIYVESQSGASSTNIGIYNAGASWLVGYVGVNINPVGLAGNPQMAISGVNGTGAPYVPSLHIQNTANATGAGVFIRFASGSGYSTGIGMIQNQWWHAMTDSTGAPVWGYDGARVRFANDTGWIAPSYQNGWADYPAPFGPCGYRKMPDGRVIIRGIVQSGTQNTVVFNLPAGYRPTEQYLGIAAAVGGAQRIDVTTAGDLTFGAMVSGTFGNGWISLNGVTFLAEA